MELNVMSFNVLNWKYEDKLRSGFPELLKKNNIDVLLMQEDFRPNDVPDVWKKLHEDITKAGLKKISSCDAEDMSSSDAIKDTPGHETGYLTNSIYVKKGINTTQVWSIPLFTPKDAELRCAALAKIVYQGKDIVLASTHLSGGSFDDKHEKFKQIDKERQIKEVMGAMKMNVDGNEGFIIGADTNAFVKNQVKDCQNHYATNVLKVPSESMDDFFNYQTIPESITHDVHGSMKLDLVKTKEEEGTTCPKKGTTQFGGVIDHFFVSPNVKVDRNQAQILQNEGFHFVEDKPQPGMSDHQPILMKITGIENDEPETSGSFQISAILLMMTIMIII